MSELTDYNLSFFTGSETCYKDPFSKILYTEGVKFLMDNGAAWFVSDTMVNIAMLDELKGQEFLHIKVEKKPGTTEAIYTIDDGNNNILYQQDIEFTDMPVEKLRMYYANNTLCLPSEY